MAYKLGFAGMGNMASAILLGGLSAGSLDGSAVLAYDPYPVKLDAIVADYGITKAASLAELADRSDIVLFAVKPNMIESVVAEMGEHLAGKAVVSIALGWRYAELAKILPVSTRIQAVMPNTPMMVGTGVCLMETTQSLTEGEHDFIQAMFASVGIVHPTPTYQMQAGGALSGCGPAFVFQFIEALADGAVYHGVPRADAYKLAAQTVMGSAKMVLETGTHPAQLKDNVCSPGGSTIRGVAALEEKGFRAAVIEAIHQSASK